MLNFRKRLFSIIKYKYQNRELLIGVHVSVIAVTPERRRIAIERTLPLVLLKREDEEEAHKSDDKFGSLREVHRDAQVHQKREKPITDVRRDPKPETVEAYVRIVMPSVNVQGIGDVPVYGYMTYTMGGSEVKSDRLVVNTGQGSGYMEIYKSNRDSQR